MELVIEKPIDELLSRIPLDAKKEVLKFLAKDEVDEEHFMDRLGTYESIQELQANYHLEMEDQFSRDVFIIQPKGLGMGEVWIAWLVKGSVISGGGESFDVLSNGTQYEAKAYNFFPHYKTKELQLGKYEGVWRLGNAGAMSNFTFVKHLTHAVDLISELYANTNAHIPELKNVLDIVKDIERLSPKYGMAADFSRGEVSKKKMRMMFKVIDMLHNYVAKHHGDYDIVTFAASTPGNPNITFKIQPATAKEIKEGKIKIIAPINEYDISDVFVLRRMLVKSKYIREGVSAIITDINKDLDLVEAKYEGINFIIFRKSGMNITSKIRRIEGTALEDLKTAVGEVFNLSSASVRVREK
jgi:hypothetical protein